MAGGRGARGQLRCQRQPPRPRPRPQLGRDGTWFIFCQIIRSSSQINVSELLPGFCDESNFLLTEKDALALGLQLPRNITQALILSQNIQTKMQARRSTTRTRGGRAGRRAWSG